MHRDFTVKIFSELLDALIQAGYQFQTFRDYLKAPKERVVILRHDVDKKPLNSLRFAELEEKKGLRASYYFRIMKESLDPSVVMQIMDMGHEIGYHYEDMDLAHGDSAKAFESFKYNLSIMRKLTPIDTICMHGSPLSKYDNKDVWKQFDYRECGIIGEPYFDIDYSRLFYLTDTGRKWNNKEASIRDKVNSPFDIEIKSTEHIIKLLRNNQMPDFMMINTHPQRWNDDNWSWFTECLMQSMKNGIKRILAYRSKEKKRA